MYTLGIETSCDETSCAVLKNYKVLSNITISSLKEHKKYGGIIPEIASRCHLKNIDKVLDIALEKANISLKDLDLIAVTYKPGLIGSLIVGLNFAKALSLSLNKPFIGVNHLYAHLFAPFLDKREKIRFPFLGLIVSGGHTQIMLIEDFDRIKILGETRDDACGEVLDKVAWYLNLGYPGGPIIDRLFDYNRRKDFSFKCGKIGFDVSFSGIKTALIYKKKELDKRGVINRKVIVGLISSFQEAIVNLLIEVIGEAIHRLKIKRVICGGGVIANTYLRKRLKEKEEGGVKFLISPFQYATDNAAIVAGLGAYLYKRKGLTSKLNLEAEC